MLDSQLLLSFWIRTDTCMKFSWCHKTRNLYLLRPHLILLKFLQSLPSFLNGNTLEFQIINLIVYPCVVRKNKDSTINAIKIKPIIWKNLQLKLTIYLSKLIHKQMFFLDFHFQFFLKEVNFYICSNLRFCLLCLLLTYIYLFLIICFI